MTTRQWINRLLLISLGLVALGGTTGILFGSHDYIWQIIGSAITIAIGGMLFLACSSLSNVDHCRHSGLLGMGIVGIEFIIVLLLIWLNGNHFFGRSNDLWELLIFNAFTLPLTGGLAMIALYLRHKPKQRLAGHLMLCIVTASELLFVIASVQEVYRMPNLTGSSEDWWMTGWSLLGYGLLAVIILAGPFRWHKIIGLLAAIAGWLMLLIEIWIGGGDRPEPFAAATILAIAFAHSNAIWMMKIKPGGQHITRIAVQTMAIITAILAQLAVTSIVTGKHEDELIRLTSAMGFILVCGTFALLVISAANHRKNRRHPVEESQLVYKELSLTCPHCQTPQNLPMGESQCACCKMQFQIKLYEPHCPQCDYLLVNCQSETCPECGHAVKQAL
ncbi:hypothetical protein JYU15_00210 [bacterium AH-315-I18]|nr:hypothetical protein [bacterium AH-315-I18]